MKKYPDITPLIELKKQHRRRLASLSFEEKTEMVFKLKEGREFFRQARPAVNASRRREQSG